MSKVWVWSRRLLSVTQVYCQSRGIFWYEKDSSWETYVNERMNPLDLIDMVGSEYCSESSWENIPDSHIMLSA